MKTIIIDGIEYNLTPKVLFKKGDFVVIQETTYQITKVENLNVTLSLNGRECLFDIDVLKNARLWDITKDAKDGDVLADGNLPFIFKKIDSMMHSYAYCGISVDSGFKIESEGEFGEWTWAQDIKPATKEQRDLLFQKMKEAGYEWDAEKKELKKIEQKPVDKYKEWYDFIRWFVEQRTDDFRLIPSNDDIHKWGDNILNHARKVLEQKPTEWSEEDERVKGNCIAYINEYKKTIQHPEITGIPECLNWLTNIRPQNRWKPTEEQIKALKDACDEHWEPDGLDPLYTLYQDLKKLKE